MRPKDIPVLAIGAVLGDSDADSMVWSRAIGVLAAQATRMGAGVESPVQISIQFHVDGRLAANDFVGVRLGRFNTRNSRLVVQVAVPREPVQDKSAYLIARLSEALEAAERFAVSRGYLGGLPQLKRLAAKLGEQGGQI